MPLGNASRAAQPFFRRCGFIVAQEQEQEVVVRGVMLPGAVMRKMLAAAGPLRG